MPRRVPDTLCICEFRLRNPGVDGLTQLETFLTLLREQGRIKGARRHVGWANAGRLDFLFEFQRTTDAVYAKVAWSV